MNKLVINQIYKIKNFKALCECDRCHKEMQYVKILKMSERNPRNYLIGMDSDFYGSFEYCIMESSKKKFLKFAEINLEVDTNRLLRIENE